MYYILLLAGHWDENMKELLEVFLFGFLCFGKTRSCAALRAADLDWIVWPEYSLGGYK